MTPSPHDALSELAALYWERRLQADPIEATLLGDHRFDDRLPDPSPAANQAVIDALGALASEVRHIDEAALAARDRVTRAALLGEIENDIAARRSAIADWAIDPRDGPHVTFQNLAQLTTIGRPEEGDAMVARWQKMAAYLDGRIANLRRSAAEGRIATQGSIRRVLAQLDEMLAAPDDTGVLLAPARAPHADWDRARLQRFRADLTAAVAEGVRPAFARYRQVIAEEILPHARDDAHGGVDQIPGGAACYERMIHIHTSLSLSADEIHAIGLEEGARINAEMLSLGAKLFGLRDLTAIQQRLRSDPALYFESRAQVEAKAHEALRRAEAAMPRWFGRITRIPCEVLRVEAYEEKDTTIAYYRQPSVDGRRPGRYYINTYAPETRPRYEAEALAFHESVPGHHTQIALAMEEPDVPEFRRHLGVTAYVEGWALYTERLADEMGLYSSDLDRMGMLSFDAWRASRLVVDTGLHTRGWSRQRAHA
ncbi:MAG TPA: DUF885 domain-containing protein, partial [Polyangia bacterium]